MTSFYTEEELKGLGFRHIGNGVCISRKASIYGAQNISLGDHVRIDDFCILSGRIEIGSYVHVAAYTALYGGSDGIFIEDFANLSSRICVYSVSDDYSGQTMTNPMVPDEYKAVKSAPVPGVDLKEGSAFGSFSFINRDPEPWSMNAGIPARKIKERSRNLLELEKQFTALHKSKSPAEPVA